MKKLCPFIMPNEIQSEGQDGKNYISRDTEECQRENCELWMKSWLACEGNIEGCTYRIQARAVVAIANKKEGR